MDTDEDKNIRVTENDLPQEFVLKLLGRYEARGLWGIKNTREPVDAMVGYAKTHELSLPIVQLVITKEGLFVSPVRCKLDNESRDRISIRKTDERRRPDRRLASPEEPATETCDREGMAKPRLEPSARASFEQAKQNYANQKTATGGRTTKEENKEKFKCFANEKTEEKRSSGPSTDLRLLGKYATYDWRKSGVFFFGIDTISYGVQDLIFTRVFSMIVVSDRNKKNSGREGSPFMCHAFVCESRSTARRVTYALAAAFQAYGRSMKFLRGPERPGKRSCDEKPRKFTIELRPPFDVALDDSEA